jgi:endoglucanase
MKYKIIGTLLLITAVAIVLTVLYQNSQRRHIPIVYSPTSMLDSLWQTFKKDYWDQNTGRTIDRQRGGVTTSEGQSYTMLRSVWQDDKQTFDKTWEWTQQNLQRPEDNLFSWLYGQKTDGTYGITTERGGENTASDADTDIALALLLAHSRWQDEKYKNEALKIIPSVWENEVVTVGGIPYLTANNIEKNSEDYLVINPSYFSPYAYKIFASLDPAHDWNALVTSSYDLLRRISASPLDKPLSVGMPPDWIAIHRVTGEIKNAPQTDQTTNYSYDALRTPWRIAIDYIWNNSDEAKETLLRFSFLKSEWESQEVLYSSYSHDGKIISKIEAPAMYGGAIGYFLAADSELAEKVYTTKLQSLYNPDIQSWKQPMSYYDDNWAWFGIALYNKLLPNLIE